MDQFCGTHQQDSTVPTNIKSSGVFIGTQKVNPAAFVDDLIDPNRTVSDIIESNENAKHFENQDRLTFKADKCKSLCFNYGKEQCIESDINGETAENVDSVNPISPGRFNTFSTWGWGGGGGGICPLSVTLISLIQMKPNLVW